MTRPEMAPNPGGPGAARRDEPRHRGLLRALLAAAALGAWLWALLAYRAAYVEPREWGAACAVLMPPAACLPREALLWLQHWQVWGLAALALGMAAFAGAEVAFLAVAAGIAGVVNYNATWGMLGACLGAWAWVSGRRGSAPAPRLAQRRQG